MEIDLTKITHEFLKTLQNRNSFEELIQFYYKDIERLSFQIH